MPKIIFTKICFYETPAEGMVLYSNFQGDKLRMIPLKSIYYSKYEAKNEDKV